ncbi:hypothetical protein BKA62DRAFT_827111 [Auriculariales sp. MPI-PUGE-AT-0066]|nr:hypothetical protein BKA62DRAFT_827111 [Auriculariales sp. MPI-PUGE-AT-0066]
MHLFSFLAVALATVSVSLALTPPDYEAPPVSAVVASPNAATDMFAKFENTTYEGFSREVGERAVSTLTLNVLGRRAKGCPDHTKHCSNDQCCNDSGTCCGDGCCPKDYGCCSKKGCKPLHKNNECCSNGGYCKKGYNCVKKKDGEIACCPKGKVCRD